MLTHHEKVLRALEALKGELTLAQLAAKHGVHQTMISTWRKQAMDGMASVFSGTTMFSFSSGSPASLSRT